MNFMRHSVCFFLFLIAMVCSSQLSAQDLLVTINNDSLNVKIEKETDRFIYYQKVGQGKNSLVISKKQISDVVYGFYGPSGRGGETIENGVTSDSKILEKKFERVQISGSLGYTRLLVLIDENDEAFEEYLNQLYNGYNYSFQVNYMFKERIGVGLVFEMAQFSNTIDAAYSNPNAPPPVVPVYGQVSDDITLKHFGANFIFRIPFKRSASAIQFDAGFGFSTYRNIAELVYGYELRGETLGISVGASYQLNLGGGLYIPIGIGIKSAVFTNLDLKTADDMPVEIKDDLNFQIEEGAGISGERFSLNIGLLYAF